MANHPAGSPLTGKWRSVKPWQVFVTLAFFGFGVQAGLAATGQWDTGREYWEYRSGTWGDLLLVPTMGAVLAAGLRSQRLAPVQRDRGLAITGGVVFGLAGLLVQVSWLAASDPIVNWTLPAAHHFSLPGWYHAAFLISVASGIGAAALPLVARLRRAPEEVRRELAGGWPAASFAGSVVALAALLIIDSADSLDTAAGQGSGAAAVAAILVVLPTSAIAFGRANAIRPLHLGLPLAAAVVWVAALAQGW